MRPLYQTVRIAHEESAAESFTAKLRAYSQITITLGVIFLFLVPTTPATAWFLTPEERSVAVRRVAQEHASSQHSEFDWAQCRATLKDPRCELIRSRLPAIDIPLTFLDSTVYLIFLWAFFVCATSVVVFGSIVINGFGFTPFKTILIGLPGPALQLGFIWLGILLLQYFPDQRSYVQTFLILPPLTGVVMLKAIPYQHKWPLVVGYWLATCNSSVFVVNMSIISTNFKGHTRKTMVSLVYFVGYCVGCVAGPQFFKSTETPLYPTAMGTCIGLYCCCK